MNQKGKNDKPQKNPRPPSVNLKKDKKPKSAVGNNSQISSKTKTADKRSTTPLKTEKSSVKDNSKISKKEKSVKINSSINTNNDKEDSAFIELIQEKANSIIEPKYDNYNSNNIIGKNLNNSFKRSENSESKLNLNYSPEIKITPNINTINKLINSSQEALNEQKNILDNITQLNKRLKSSEFDMQQNMDSAENNDFNNFTDKYLGSLHEVIEKLKIHSEEMENIKCI